ncbi:MAG: glycosyltransferase [Actinobacteria bacterium]|nr:glycosyltransferase [Actinomycetota bacterium]
MSSDLTVVVASVNGFPYLGECLEALERNAGEAHVVVADWTDEPTRAHVRERWPDVQLLSFNEPATVPELRAAGIAAATSPFVAVIEDHCLATPGWADAIVTAHRTGEHVVGGGVRNVKTQRVRDWAPFFCEYSAFMEPFPAGEVENLTGMNVSYDRQALAEIADLLGQGRWENDLHARLRDRGYRFWSVPEGVIEHAKDFGFLEFASQRYHYSRSYAGMRNGALGARRFAMALAAPLLVPLLSWRIARNARSKPGYGDAFRRSAPLVLLYTVIWAFGELVGYTLGGGRSILKVR